MEMWGLYKGFTIFICILFVLMPLSSAADNNTSIDLNNNSIVEGTYPDDYVFCGVESSIKLLESQNITYNSSKLEKCICENSTECNADILTIRQCLNEEGLITYAYTVNETQLQTGDIIHFDFNGTGHYEVFDENRTNLTGFTGHIITIRELKDQEQVHLQLQEEIKGQCPPCYAAIILCMSVFPCQFALRSALQQGATSLRWCKNNPQSCMKYLNDAKVAVEGVLGSGSCNNGNCKFEKLRGSSLTEGQKQKIKEIIKRRH